jgi:hypothetical protein
MTTAAVWTGIGSTLVPMEVPIDLGRDEARELAHRELSKPIYERDRPILTRVVEWLVDQLEHLLAAASGTLSSQLGVAVLIAAVAVLSAVIILRTGPIARRAVQRTGPIMSTPGLTAAQRYAAADNAARQGKWRVAVIERFRSIVTRLEERGILDTRSGRTADETAREAAAVRADLAEQWATAATLFNAVRYGRAGATAADDEQLRRLYSDAEATGQVRAGARSMVAAPR